MKVEIEFYTFMTIFISLCKRVGTVWHFASTALLKPLTNRLKTLVRWACVITISAISNNVIVIRIRCLVGLSILLSVWLRRFLLLWRPAQRLFAIGNHCRNSKWSNYATAAKQQWNICAVDISSIALLSIQANLHLTQLPVNKIPESQQIWDSETTRKQKIQQL